MTQPPEEPETLSSEIASQDDGDSFNKLIPPVSRGEQFRDALLRHLDHPFFQILGIVVIFLVIIDGAFFFFLLVGWHGMCQPRMDCEPRNWWYNASIQILNVLFTYMALVSMPWRSTHFLHITKASCPYRRNAVGHDLYGIPVTNDAWFHIPLPKRLGIILLLLLNCVTQFANQITRIVYHSFEQQNTVPGNIWTNVFLRPVSWRLEWRVPGWPMKSICFVERIRGNLVQGPKKYVTKCMMTIWRGISVNERTQKYWMFRRRIEQGETPSIRREIRNGDRFCP